MLRVFDFVAGTVGTAGRWLNLDGSIRSWIVRHPAVAGVTVFGLLGLATFWPPGWVLVVGALVFLAFSRSR